MQGKGRKGCLVDEGCDYGVRMKVGETDGDGKRDMSECDEKI